MIILENIQQLASGAIALGKQVRLGFQLLAFLASSRRIAMLRHGHSHSFDLEFLPFSTQPQTHLEA